VKEGGEKSFSIMTTSSLGDSGGGLTLRMATGPQYGQVLLVASARRNSGVREVNLTSAALSELFDPDVRLVYRHDGSETVADEFVLVLSDGRHVVSRTCRVAVAPVNDARPVLATNSVLRVPQGGSAVITADNLRATDDDSDDEQVRSTVFYVIIVRAFPQHSCSARSLQKSSLISSTHH